MVTFHGQVNLALFPNPGVHVGISRMENSATDHVGLPTNAGIAGGPIHQTGAGTVRPEQQGIRNHIHINPKLHRQPDLKLARQQIPNSPKVAIVRQDQVLPTPVSSAKLAEVLEGYDSNIKNFLLQGFREGFHLHYEGERVSVRAPNLKSAFENPGEVRKKISKEISAGRIAGPFTDPPFELFRCSPIGLQPKKDGGFRMI